MICKQVDKCKGNELRHPVKPLKDPLGGDSNYKLKNPRREAFNLLEFEGCVYKNIKIGKRCDYGLLLGNTVIYIELKGSEAKEGIEQLISTIDDTEKCFRGFNKKVRLICKDSRPDITIKTKSYKRLAEKVNYRKNSNNNFVRRNKFFEETYQHAVK